jgi:CubicO group peptidase (beta-lactamase class C family)
VKSWCDAREIPACAVSVTLGGKTSGVHLFGRQTLASDSPAVRDDAIFLIASITKPIVATGALLLAERGLISLDDRVEEYVPGFGREAKHAVTIRNLLTHTSGLPDMLPNNFELRAAHAPLSEFVAGACASKLDFLPGRGVQYQSMGFAMLAEVIQQVSGKTCAQFLDDEIFQPLGMNDTALGAPASWFPGPHPKVERIAEVFLPPESGMTNERSKLELEQSLLAPAGSSVGRLAHHPGRPRPVRPDDAGTGTTGGLADRQPRRDSDGHA